MKTLFTFLLSICSLQSVIAQSFSDVASAAGLNHLFDVGDYHFGGGAAIIDFNNDGFEDIYVTGGANNDVLYQNNGDGTFTDVSVSANISSSYGFLSQGAIAGDFDNDGFDDLFITCRGPVNDFSAYGTNLLLKNNGNGTFSDVTVNSGVSNEVAFSTSAAFVDVNNDGFLDIYVANYWHEPFDDIVNEVGTLANFGSWEFTGRPNNLYVNNGDGTFTEAASQYGIDNNGVTWAVTFSDFDNDRDQDLMVLNDFGQEIVQSSTYQNEYPQESFTNITSTSGFNDLQGYDLTAMGVAVGDYDLNGTLDYYVTNTGKNFLFKNNGSGYFSDVTDQAGVRNEFYDVPLDTVYPWATNPICGCHWDSVVVGWGTNFVDYDNDMDLDLFVSNGSMNPNVFFGTDMGNTFYENNGDGTFTDITVTSNLGATDICRGSVSADFDNDGDIDLLVVVQKYYDGFSPQPTPNIHLYQNELNNTNNWLKVKLRGTLSNSDGVGARIRAVVGSQSLVQEVDGGSSTHSSNSKIVHFGLSGSTDTDTLQVLWPSGCVDEFYNVSANQLLEITESCILVGTRPTNGSNEFSIYPNPSSDILNIHNPYGVTVTIEIHNTLGEIMLQHKNILHKPKIDLTKLPTGTYSVRLISKTTTWIEKLVIVK